MTDVTAARFAAAARAAVPRFLALEVLAAAGERQRTHGDLLNLAAGQPYTPPSTPVIEAARRALDDRRLSYTVAPGIPELREAIAGHYAAWYPGLGVTPEDVMVTTGSSGGFLATFLAAFDVGDRVAMARPSYPCYRNILAALGCEVVDLPCGPAERWQPTVAVLEALERPIDGLVIASPANPTGTMLAAGELAAIAAWCEANGVRLISDELYHGVSFDGAPPASVWHTSRSAVVVNSFSKYFSMTGWRLGWLLVPEELRRPVEGLIGNFSICAPTLSQLAGVAAFTPESHAELAGHVERYRRNRDVLLDGLAALGITRIAPADGAFYVWADLSHRTADTLDWCRRLLAATGVALGPGVDFDPVDGSRHVRISFGGEPADIRGALDRLNTWLESADGI
ncbi:MAG TPA: aminotransferase class I/II-fold pyridoxal phosphate-dependent enzyme [Pseudonocardiaceae bacterium]